jgi:hypothetical protein
VYITGVLLDTVDFDPGPGTFNLTEAGNGDIFIVKWSQSSTPANMTPVFNGLPSGNTITVTEGQTANFTIQATGPETGQIVTTTVNTNNVCGVSANITNGTTSTTVLSVTGMACNVGSNTFTLTATDNASPNLSTTVTLTLIVTALPCNVSASAMVSGTTVTITASGGTPPYTYTLGSTTNNTGIFSGLSNGTYTYTVRDARNCTATGSVTVTIITPPLPSGDACPRDTTIVLASCNSTTTVRWAVPTDTFPATIIIPAGLTPDVLTPTGQGRLNFLGSFGGHGYYRSTDSYRWPVANNIAMSTGGHLTTLTSADENAFVTSSVSSYGYFSWIGLMRNSVQSNFAWVTGEPLSYTNWGPADPNNFGGSAQNLVEPYVHITEVTGKWHDLLDVSIPFLAEFEAPLIRWRQISGPANGSNLGAGVYSVCYERTNVVTNQRDSCCFTVTVRCNVPLASEELITIASTQSKAIKNLVYTFRITASPNPTPNSFTLKVASNDSKGRINLKVMDIAGRVVETRDGLTPNQTVQIGNRYKSGVYFVQVMQGTRSTVLKLVKQSE